MKMKRFLAVILAVLCLGSTLCMEARAAVTELPAPETWFGPVLKQTTENGKTALDFAMPEYDEEAVQAYLDVLVENCGLKLKKSYRIKDYGDYYHSLYKGYANCLMLYWDNSLDQLTVTVFDRVACFAQPAAEGPIVIPAPDAFLEEPCLPVYQEADSAWYYGFALPSFPEQKVEDYVRLLMEDCGLMLTHVYRPEDRAHWTYTLRDGQQNRCVYIYVRNARQESCKVAVSVFLPWCIPEGIDGGPEVTATEPARTGTEDQTGALRVTDPRVYSLEREPPAMQVGNKKFYLCPENKPPNDRE